MKNVSSLGYYHTSMQCNFAFCLNLHVKCCAQNTTHTHAVSSLLGEFKNDSGRSKIIQLAITENDFPAATLNLYKEMSHL